MDDQTWPEHLLAANHPARAWNARSDATWEAIRQDYLSGVPARELCDRYEVALSTLRLKAKEGGWRRADQADSDLFPADADRWADDAGHDAGFDSEEEDWVDLAGRARFRLRRAIASGRAAEAASWLRVHDRLRALAAAEIVTVEPPPEVEPEPEQDPVDRVITVAGRVSSIALRAARATDDATIEALEAELEGLEGQAAALISDSASQETGPTLDSLDPVFSDSPDRAALLRTRERRLELGLGVADLDQALAELDRAWTGRGLSP